MDENLHKSQVRLYNNIKSSGTNVAADKVLRDKSSFGNEETYYARGKERLRDAITSAIQIVADLETPTRQCTKVAAPSHFPLPRELLERAFPSGMETHG